MAMRTMFLFVLVPLLVAAAPASPAQATLAPVGSGVVGAWQGEGDAADPFNAHDGTLLGGAAFAPSTSGQAFSFTGAQQAVDIPDAPDLYPDGSFTIAGWIRTTDAVSDQALIEHYECGLFCPTGGANSVYLLALSGGKANGYVRDTTGNGPLTGGQGLTGTADLADGAFHHLAFVRDVAGGQIRLLVDGALAESQALDPGAAGALASLDGEADDLYLGAVRRCLLPQPSSCDGSLVNQVTGQVDDIVDWSRVVSDAEIAAIHAAGPNGLTTDVTAPASSATAPATVTAGPIQVGFTAEDPQGPAPRVHDPSSVDRVDLYARAPGEAALHQVASAAGTSGGFTYAPQAGNGAYAFATVAVDAAGNAEALPAAPDAVTTLAPPAAPAAPQRPAQAPAAPKVVPVQTIVAGLPPATSPRTCLSRRRFTITVRRQAGTTIAAVVVTLGAKRMTVRRSGGVLRSVVDLRGLKAGRYTIKVTATLGDGRRITGSRTYRTCAPKRHRA